MPQTITISLPAINKRDAEKISILSGEERKAALLAVAEVKWSAMGDDKAIATAIGMEKRRVGDFERKKLNIRNGKVKPADTDINGKHYGLFGEIVSVKGTSYRFDNLGRVPGHTGVHVLRNRTTGQIQFFENAKVDRWVKE